MLSSPALRLQMLSAGQPPTAWQPICCWTDHLCKSGWWLGSYFCSHRRCWAALLCNLQPQANTPILQLQAAVEQPESATPEPVGQPRSAIPEVVGQPSPWTQDVRQLSSAISDACWAPLMQTQLLLGSSALQSRLLLGTPHANPSCCWGAQFCSSTCCWAAMYCNSPCFVADAPSTVTMNL